MSALVSIASRIVSKTRVAKSVRFIFAMFQLIAAEAEWMGRALIELLEKQFPGQKLEKGPVEVGNQMLNKARKEVENPADAEDVVQDWLMYVTSGYGGDPDDPTAYPAGEYPFHRDHSTIQSAFRHAINNIGKRGISKSRGRTIKEMVPVIDPDTGKPVIDPETGKPQMEERQTRREKGIEETFGRTTEEGGKVPAEERMEDVGAQPLDDQAAIKQFLDVIEEFVPDLLSELPYEQATLFNLVFEEGVGTFSSDVKSNMAQASELKKIFEREAKSEDPDIAKKAQKVLDTYSKRWSGFVGDTRRKLLDNIQKFILDYMPQEEYEVLYDMYFADVPEREIERPELEGLPRTTYEGEKEKAKKEEQLGKDIRKLGKLKWKKNKKEITKKEETSLENLTKKLEKAGIDTGAVEPLDPKTKAKITDKPDIPWKEETEKEEEEEEEEEKSPETVRMSPEELEEAEAAEVEEEEEEEEPPTVRAAPEEEEDEEPPTMRWEEEEEPKTQRMPAHASYLVMASRILSRSVKPKYM